MKKYKFLLCAFLFAGILLASSCHSSKRGIVPCPSFGQIEQQNHQKSTV